MSRLPPNPVSGQNNDVDLPVTEYQFQGLDWIGGELKYRRHFYDELFQEVIVESSARMEAVRLIVEENIELEDMRIAGGELIRPGDLKAHKGVSRECEELHSNKKRDIRSFWIERINAGTHIRSVSFQIIILI
ncbi:hypothetical protein GIB67_010385 [Kingdonia uniflora]|uniref:Large ribosomal subunit protein bL20c n=1 Tax=Kingdonia uniflora TaxID=39325 RepID=A0A7J7MA98_9MAGN|nr:hypothetical protein GIB67_010385 [Kingdonia uniflora]